LLVLHAFLWHKYFSTDSLSALCRLCLYSFLLLLFPFTTPECILLYKNYFKIIRDFKE